MDKLFVQSDWSNAGFDHDEVVLDIMCLTIYGNKQKVTKQPQKYQVKDILKVANPQMSIQEKNVVAYIS